MASNSNGGGEGPNGTGQTPETGPQAANINKDKTESASFPLDVLATIVLYNDNNILSCERLLRLREVSVGWRDCIESHLFSQHHGRGGLIVLQDGLWLKDHESPASVRTELSDRMFGAVPPTDWRLLHLRARPNDSRQEPTPVVVAGEADPPVDIIQLIGQHGSQLRHLAVPYKHIREWLTALPEVSPVDYGAQHLETLSVHYHPFHHQANRHRPPWREVKLLLTQRMALRRLDLWGNFASDDGNSFVFDHLSKLFSRLVGVSYRRQVTSQTSQTDSNDPVDLRQFLRVVTGEAGRGNGPTQLFIEDYGGLGKGSLALPKLALRYLTKSWLARVTHLHLNYQLGLSGAQRNDGGFRPETRQAEPNPALEWLKSDRLPVVQVLASLCPQHDLLPLTGEVFTHLARLPHLTSWTFGWCEMRATDWSSLLLSTTMDNAIDLPVCARVERVHLKVWHSFLGPVMMCFQQQPHQAQWTVDRAALTLTRVLGHVFPGLRQLTVDCDQRLFLVLEPMLPVRLAHVPRVEVHVSFGV